MDRRRGQLLDALLDALLQLPAAAAEVSSLGVDVGQRVGDDVADRRLLRQRP
jgi:hypothetical protein